MTTLSSTPTDFELVQLAQEGAQDALVKLYERYLPLVYNRVRYTVPVEDVEDVTQEVFISAIRSLKSFRGDAKFSTWLRTLTIRQIAEYYRKRRAPTSPLNEDMVAPRDPCDADDILLLKQALRKIPDKYREILLLRFAEEIPFQEIARIQGKSLEAVKSLFRRALAALHKQVAVHE